MIVSVSYGASSVRLPQGGWGVRLERAVDTRSVCGFEETSSTFTITLTPGDALEMVRAYRARDFRSLKDVEDDRKEICLNIISGESYSLEWWGKGKVVEDDLWSDWPQAFMAEVESIAKEVSK